MDDFVTTTIYFDGQFWSALVAKQENGRIFTGRYVFGAEPSNPRLLYWMMHEFSGIQLFPSELEKIPVKKMIRSERSAGVLCRSFDAFKAAQSVYLSERKEVRREKQRTDRAEEWQRKREKRKQKKRH